MSTLHPLVDTVRALFSDASLLVRQEITLARAEAEEKLEQAQSGLISIGASLVIALAALLILAQALVIALGNFMPPSLAALLVGVVLAVIAFITMQAGQNNLKPKNLAPRRTMNSVRDSADTIKESSNMSHKPEIIEDEIALTRQRIDMRLKSISNEFSAGRVMDSVLGKGGNGNTFDAVATKARENPAAAVLIGAGLLGLLLSKSTRGSDELHDPHISGSSPEARIGSHIDSLRDQADQSYNSAVDGASEAVSSVKAEATMRANDAKRTVSEAVDSASAHLSDAKATVRKAARQAPVRAQAQVEGAVDWIRDNPVPSGLLALAAGAAISSFFTARSSTSRLDASKRLHDEARENDDTQNAAQSKRTKVAKTAMTKTTKAEKAKPPKTAVKSSSAAKTKASAAPKAPSKAKMAKLSPTSTPLENPKTNVTRTQPLVSTDQASGSTSLSGKT